MSQRLPTPALHDTHTHSTQHDYTLYTLPYKLYNTHYIYSIQRGYTLYINGIITHSTNSVHSLHNPATHSTLYYTLYTT